MFIITFIISIALEAKIEAALQIAFVISLFFCGGIIFLFIIMILLSGYVARKFITIKKLNKEDFINDKQMHRDILDEYSPVLLAYIDSMSYDYDVLVTAGLLSLKRKGYIELKKDKIDIIKYDYYNLDVSERHIIENIKNGKVSSDNGLFKNIIIDTKKKDLLVEDEHYTKNKTMKRLFALTAIYFFVVFPIVEVLLELYLESEFLVSFIKIIFVVIYIFVFVYINIHRNNSYHRSKKAKELNKKLEGLKNFIKRFSKLDEKHSK